MKIELLIIVFILYIYTVNAQDFSVSPSSKTMDITFNSPKGEKTWSNPYSMDFDILVTNERNATLSVSVSPSSSNPSYVRLSSSKSVLNIPPLGSGSVRITVKTVDSAADGGVYSGRVRFASNLQTEYVNVQVKTFWPPPTLVLFGDLDFGELKAGSSYSRSFTIREIYKFRRATNVKIELVEKGPILDAAASPSTFSYIDHTGRNIKFTFRVKERGLEPGTYSPDIGVSSSNNARLISRLKYSIPRPIVEISKPAGELFFDYGTSGAATQALTIFEKGGKTPLENTVVSFEKLIKVYEGKQVEYGAAAWFKFPEQTDYISPGGSRTIDIRVNKPEDAPTGRYIWEGSVKTKYAGVKPFQFYFIVRPPELETKKKILTGLKSDPLAIDFPEGENLRKTTEYLLIRDTSAMVDISNVTSLTDVVIAFFNSTNAAYTRIQQGESSYNGAYEEFRASKEEKGTLESIKLKQIYGTEISTIKNSADNVWKDVGLLLRNKLEEYANRLKDPSYPDASYAEAREVHEKIREICSWMNDINCEQAQDNRINEMNNKIKELILEAYYLENETGRIHEDIHSGTWGFLGTRLIKNPAKFAYFFNKYDIMIENYINISRNYKLSGEKKSLEESREKLDALRTEYRSFKLANSILVVLSGFILFLTVWKTGQGFVRYMADAKDVELADVARLKKLNL